MCRLPPVAGPRFPERPVAREVDRLAAFRKQGMWMGGRAPLGYRVENRKLILNEEEAAIVRMVFERFLTCGSATVVAKAAANRFHSRDYRPFPMQRCASSAR